MYIGRENKKLKLCASKWQNPYRVRDYGGEMALDKYKYYIERHDNLYKEPDEFYN